LRGGNGERGCVITGVPVDENELAELRTARPAQGTSTSDVCHRLKAEPAGCG